MPTHLLTNVLFYALQVGAILTVFMVSPTRESVTVLVVLYVVRMFGITAGFHRYFAHKSFKTTRAFQFILALLGTLALQKGPLWWARTHRLHHLYSDTEKDPHSPIAFSWFYAHLGWISSGDTPEMQKLPTDLAKFWELRVLDRFHALPGILLAVACYFYDGLAGLGWAFCFSTFLLYHTTFMVNSVCHIWGTRPYDTPDRSRNNALVAILTMGEGWHNNHHHEQACVRQGRKWWQIDVTYYLLRVLALFRIVWAIREPKHNEEQKAVA